jgi:MFS family permease
MAAEHAAEGTNRAAITVCVILATIMQALDTTIANIALPYIQGSVSATQDQINWVLTSYIVAAAIMTPLTGFLAGRFGRKRLFLVAVTGFTVASMLCGMAQSLVQIVLFRTLQGMFGAALVPLSQSVLIDINPPARRGWRWHYSASPSWSDPCLAPSSVVGSPRITPGVGYSISTFRSEPLLSSASALSCRTPTATPVQSWIGSVSVP